MRNLSMSIGKVLALWLSVVGSISASHASEIEGKGVVLIVASSAEVLELRGGRTIPTGTYLNELVIPAVALIEAGYELRLATPTGAKPVIDVRSRDASHFGGDVDALNKATEFFASHPAIQQPRSLRDVLDEGLDRYAAVFVPGGHAPITDLARDADFGAVLRHFHDGRKPTALLCHAPIALIATVPDRDGFQAAMTNGDKNSAVIAASGWPYAGYKMTVFSNQEELGVEERVFQGKLKFHAADALRVAGGTVTRADAPFEPNVVRDRELITGQNPGSDRALAGVLVDTLQALSR